MQANVKSQGVYGYHRMGAAMSSWGRREKELLRKEGQEFPSSVHLRGGKAWCSVHTELAYHRSFCSVSGLWPILLGRFPGVWGYAGHPL